MPPRGRVRKWTCRNTHLPGPWLRDTLWALLPRHSQASCEAPWEFPGGNKGLRRPFQTGCPTLILGPHGPNLGLLGTGTARTVSRSPSPALRCLRCASAQAIPVNWGRRCSPTRTPLHMTLHPSLAASLRHAQQLTSGQGWAKDTVTWEACNTHTQAHQRLNMWAQQKPVFFEPSLRDADMQTGVLSIAKGTSRWGPTQRSPIREPVGTSAHMEKCGAHQPTLRTLKQDHAS